MRRVLIVQRRLTHYRVPLFNRLRSELESKGIQLLVAHGDPTQAERMRHDSGQLPWADRLATRYVFGGAICWQPFAAVARGCDLVVLTHENKLVSNLGEQFCRSGVRKVALWGHGANLQGDPGGLKERFKRRTMRQADWWFAYSELSRSILEGAGFSPNRISVLNNTIDTSELRLQLAELSEENVKAVRSSLGISGEAVGLYCGSLYAEKRIEFLLKAAEDIRSKVPNFELLIVGDGPDRSKVERFCQAHSWAHYLGARKGKDKAEILKLAKVLLNPGGVGLGVLDSFVSGVPLVTTKCGLHGPEIAYLEDDRNGRISSNDIATYAGIVADLLTDEIYRRELVLGCAESSLRYSIASMASKFSDGILQCLELPGTRGRA